jgi:excisionase family DNA binding protein
MLIKNVWTPQNPLKYGYIMVTPSLKPKENQVIKKAQRISSPLSKRLYTLKQAAEYLGRSEWGMRELIWAGSIPVVRVEDGRKIFLDIEDLNDFINRNKSIYL